MLGSFEDKHLKKLCFIDKLNKSIVVAQQPVSNADRAVQI
jgi:hypothetical protein